MLFSSASRENISCSEFIYISSKILIFFTVSRTYWIKGFPLINLKFLFFILLLPIRAGIMAVIFIDLPYLLNNRLYCFICDFCIFIYIINYFHYLVNIFTCSSG